ncbi:MAG TPA: hypothetical protein VGO79_14835 [Thermoanaerobaculia bacterium]
MPATAASFALMGFLVLTAFTSHQAPLPCCSRCERCVSSVCQDPPANTSLKTELAAPIEIAAPFLVLDRPQLSLLATGAHRASRFALPGFDPPMRN